MPLLETKGAASAQGFGGAGAGASGLVTYIEDVFSTWLYTGTGSTQTITNGINLSGKGGMVWLKSRTQTAEHSVFDTNRGVNKYLSTEQTAAQVTTVSSFSLNQFNANGFQLGLNNSGENAPGQSIASWTFRKQPKFFDVVTYTGNGAQNQVISHNLGSAPGCVIIKRTDTTSDWWVAHIGVGSGIAYAGGALRLNDTNAWSSSGNVLFTTGTSTSITLYQGPGATAANISGGTYVAYLFAHNAGGFGLTGTDNVISCGSYVGTGTVNTLNVNLGWEPQWVMIKSATTSWDWYINDNMRGTPVPTSTGPTLSPNTSSAESTKRYVYPTATGFGIYDNEIETNQSGQTYIYIAIRRGPMKVPTSGTSVFGLSARTGTGANATVTGSAGVSDAVLIKNRGAAVGDLFASRLTGTGYLETSSTAVEVAAGTTILQANPWDVMDGVKVGTTSTITNASSNTYINYLFDRAPGFFDVVCYTGTGSGPLYVPHNLGVVPEFIIIKTRSNTSDWVAGQGPAFYTSQLYVNSNIARSSTGLDMSMQTSSNIAVGWSSQLSLNLPTNVNVSGYTYVAYLFATCAGVSKVGSYTGTGALQTVNCGFTGGARFVLIKRTDSTGDWYVYDSARGISSGNDPYLFLNSTAAEVTGTNYVDTTSVGFQVTAAAPAGLNASGGSFVFLAIA